jgi:hypothetical protein
MLARDGIRLLMQDDRNVKEIDNLKLAYVAPDVPNVPNADTYRLVMLWKTDIPWLHFDALRWHYNIPEFDARVNRVAGFEDLLRLKTMHDNAQPRDETATLGNQRLYSTVARGTQAAVATDGSTAVAKAEPPSDELIMQRVSNQIATALQQMVRTVDGHTADIAALQGTMLGQSTKYEALQEEVKAELREQQAKVEAIGTSTQHLLHMTIKSNLMNLCNDYEKHLEAYGRLKAKLQQVLSAEVRSDTVQGIAAYEKRLQKKLAEIHTVAEQGQIDISDQLQDFALRQA